jgi:hypothetical protein
MSYVPVFEPTRTELDVIFESTGRGDEGVKLPADLINNDQRRASTGTLIENEDPHERIM